MVPRDYRTEYEARAKALSRELAGLDLDVRAARRFSADCGLAYLVLPYYHARVRSYFFPGTVTL
jgi:hypothetical protein